MNSKKMTKKKESKGSYGPSKSYVMIKGEKVSMDNCKFLDIESDITGRDVVTVEYQNEIFKSFVLAN